jgi:dipeptidyl aminopeptidase/acylaminoacyl peptidase
MAINRMFRNSLIFAGIIFSLIPVPGTAGVESKPAETRITPWTPGDILSAESAFQWKVSPDGKWAVWVKAQMDKDKNARISNLFLTNLETQKEIQLTRGAETHGRPEWSPSGELISFTSTRPLPKPNPDISRSQLWLINPFGGEPWPLTEFVRGIRGYRWTDDNTIIFSAQEDPALYEQELKKRKDTTRAVDDVDHEPPVRLFKLAVKDKKVTRLTGNTDFIQSWAVTADGKRAAAVHGQYLSFEWDHKILPRTFLHDLAGGEPQDIFAGQRIVPTSSSASGERSSSSRTIMEAPITASSSSNPSAAAITMTIPSWTSRKGWTFSSPKAWSTRKKSGPSAGQMDPSFPSR